MPGQSAKGNPASIRMGNSHRKELRARSQLKGEARKAERRRKQEEAHKRNLASGTTPWKEAKARRYEARAPKRAAWLKRQENS